MRSAEHFIFGARAMGGGWLTTNWHRYAATASYHIWALLPALILIGMLIIIGIGVTRAAT